MTDALVRLLQSWGDMNLESALVLALVFVVTGLMLVPRTFLCLASGILFGLPAIAVILPSTTLGGMIGFLLARYFFADKLQRMVERRPRWRAILNAVDSESWRVVGLLRFGSPIPTAVQNYLFGLTRIGLWPFTAATFIFTIPQVCLHVYLGATGRAALLNETSSALSQGLIALGILSLLAVTLLIARKARAALRDMPASTDGGRELPSRAMG